MTTNEKQHSAANGLRAFIAHIEGLVVEPRVARRIREQTIQARANLEALLTEQRMFRKDRTMAFAHLIAHERQKTAALDRRARLWMELFLDVGQAIADLTEHASQHPAGCDCWACKAVARHAAKRVELTTELKEIKNAADTHQAEG